MLTIEETLQTKLKFGLQVKQNKEVSLNFTQMSSKFTHLLRFYDVLKFTINVLTALAATNLKQSI